MSSVLYGKGIMFFGKGIMFLAILLYPPVWYEGLDGGTWISVIS